MGAPQVGPWDGLSSPRRCNPAVKEVHGEAEPVQREDGRQRTRARKTSPAQAEAPTGAHIERKAREMSAVFVLDAERRPLAPVHPGRARLLLKAGQAAVFKRYPFTIILKRSVAWPAPQRFRLKIDPGSKTTGLALVDEQTHEVVWAADCGALACAQGRAPGAQAAPYPLQTGEVCQPAQERRLAAALPAESGAERGDLGPAVAQALPHRGALAGAGEF